MVQGAEYGVYNFCDLCRYADVVGCEALGLLTGLPLYSVASNVDRDERWNEDVPAPWVGFLASFQYYQLGFPSLLDLAYVIVGLRVNAVTFVGTTYARNRYYVYSTMGVGYLKVTSCERRPMYSIHVLGCAPFYE